MYNPDTRRRYQMGHPVNKENACAHLSTVISKASLLLQSGDCGPFSSPTLLLEWIFLGRGSGPDIYVSSNIWGLVVGQIKALVACGCRRPGPGMVCVATSTSEHHRGNLSCCWRSNIHARPSLWQHLRRSIYVERSPLLSEQRGPYYNFVTSYASI